jgi:predicted amino acid dehydrogenase
MTATHSILVLTSGGGDRRETLTFLERDIDVQFCDCGGDQALARQIITAHRDRVDAIGLEAWPTRLYLASASRHHETGQALRESGGNTPVVDGSGVRAGLERWGVILADRAEPGLFADKRALMCPGLNHPGLAQALASRGRELRYADPVVYFGLPAFPGVAARTSLEQSAAAILETLHSASPQRLAPTAEPRSTHGHAAIFRRADIIAGDARAIRRFAPDELRHKTIVVDYADEADIEDFRQRGVSIVVTMMPPLTKDEPLARHSAAVLEAVLVALRARVALPLTEDTYLDMIADLDWRPGIVYLQPEEAGINRFAFVIHPLSIRQIHAHPRFRWTRFLPDPIVEWSAARLPPMFVSKVTGACSPVTGQKVEGYLYTLAATPRQLMKRGVRSTYTKLHQIAVTAQRRGARIMGLGAFTSVVGDAGRTVAHESDIAVTSGNSLTVAATLEAAKQAVIKMGAPDLTRGRAMIVGATGSIGAVCARLIAQAIKDVVLISIEPERLIELKRKIQRETPGARVVIGTRASEHLAQCDLVVTSTSAFGQRVVDVSQCKPGAVVCDVARPHDISPEEAAVRPDVLVIDSGEVLIPGDIDFGYDIGLPPGIAYACLAETCLLAMDGRFEDYTIGRELHMGKVKEIYRLFKKHEFHIAGLHSFDEDVTDEVVVEKRRLAQALRDDPQLCRATIAQARKQIARIPVAAKGVRARARRAWLPQSWLKRVISAFDRHRPTRLS